jgi:hypothetical protein
MSLGYWGPEVLEYPNGAPAANEDVRVVIRNTNTDIPLFDDIAGTPLSQPIYTDSGGNLDFFAEQGDYDFLVNGGRIQITVIPIPSGGLGYIHHQVSAAATWTIPHNLGKKAPVLLLVDGDGNKESFTDTSYPDLNTTILEFPSAVTGFAYL